LGARMYFMQVNRKDKSNTDYIADLTQQKNYRKRVDECNQATMRFLKGIWREDKFDWNNSNDPKDVLEKVVLLAKVVTRLRGKINVSVKDYNDETHYTQPIIEEPDRCIQALYALMRGHALMQGRTQIQDDDLPIVIDVALCSAPWDRINAFYYLLSKDSVTTQDLTEDLKCSRMTAIRTMKTLELLDLVELQKEPYPTNGGDQTGYIMKLKQEFKWFKSAMFQSYWQLKSQIKTERKRRTDTDDVLPQMYQTELKV